MNRRRPAHRLTSALIGAIITAMGVLTGALLSGRDLDTDLIAIVALASVGGWLLITALLSGTRPRSGAWTAEPTPVPYATSGAPPTSDASLHEGAPSRSEAPLTSAARSAASKAKRGSTDAL